MYRQKVDISYCGDKTGFPRIGHIYASIRVESNLLMQGHTIKFHIIMVM